MPGTPWPRAGNGRYKKLYDNSNQAQKPIILHDIYTIAQLQLSCKFHDIVTTFTKVIDTVRPKNLNMILNIGHAPATGEEKKKKRFCEHSNLAQKPIILHDTYTMAQLQVSCKFHDIVTRFTKVTDTLRPKYLTIILDITFEKP